MLMSALPSLDELENASEFTARHIGPWADDEQHLMSVIPAGSSSALFEAIHALTLEIAQHGEFNFLLSNGDCLFAHASTRLSHIVRQAPFAQAHLKDQDLSVDFSDVTSPDDRVAVIATLPLTDNEVWTEMPPGTLWWFEEGAPVKTLPTRPGPVKKP